jgi:hypothetical protein
MKSEYLKREEAHNDPLLLFSNTPGEARASAAGAAPPF